MVFDNSCHHKFIQSVSSPITVIHHIGIHVDHIISGLEWTNAHVPGGFLESFAAVTGN